MIHYLPLERLDARYTAHLDDSIIDYLNAAGLEYRRYYPSMSGREAMPPPPGRFLNARATIEFKARQLAELCQHDWADGDLVFASDLWFPGLEALDYLSFFTERKLRLRGLLHAGSFTDTDFVRQLERWSSRMEEAILDQAEQVYVGSAFIADDVARKRLVDRSKLVVTGFPLDPQLDRLLLLRAPERRPLVVFTGRICDEKQPWLFDEMARRFRGSDVAFVKTQELGLAKPDYYKGLQEAKVVVSFALQENFGFGVLEAARLGCVPIVPNRLVYPELFPAAYLYDSFEEAVELVRAALAGRLKPTPVPNFADAPRRWFA